jgi:diguanylate cyclase (GGDEF)-like protein
MNQVPKLIDIATKEVLKIDETRSIDEALKLMYEHNHRDIIICSQVKSRLGILRANDLIKLEASGIDFNSAICTVKYDMVFTMKHDINVHDAVEQINSEHSSICLLNETDELCGYVSYYDIISSVDPQVMLEKRKLTDILMSSNIKKAHQDDSTKSVIALMNDNIYDCVVIYDNENNAVGIITTKDIVKLFGERKDLQKRVSSYMSTPLESINHTASIAQALEFIQSRNFKRIIVKDEDNIIVGLITQEELISKIYTKWAKIVNHEKSQLQQLNMALKNKAALFEQQASMDKLTSLYNRVKLEQVLSDEIARVQRYKSETFSICLFDVDDFKSINDEFGHITGDIILQRIAGVVKNGIRTTDVGCRWGGEEFIVVFPLTNIFQAAEACEKLRKSINHLSFDGVKSVSCSFGVAQFEFEDTTHSLISRADEAMYKAKKSGKNRVEVGF